MAVEISTFFIVTYLLIESNLVMFLTQNYGKYALPVIPSQPFFEASEDIRSRNSRWKEEFTHKIHHSEISIDFYSDLEAYWLKQRWNSNGNDKDEINPHMVGSTLRDVLCHWTTSSSV